MSHEGTGELGPLYINIISIPSVASSINLISIWSVVIVLIYRRSQQECRHKPDISIWKANDFFIFGSALLHGVVYGQHLFWYATLNKAYTLVKDLYGLPKASWALGRPYNTEYKYIVAIHHTALMQRHELQLAAN